jgi:threonine synthase
MPYRESSDASKLESSTPSYHCYACGEAGPLESGFKCPKCDTPRSLVVKPVIPDNYLSREPDSLWHYFPLLPIGDRKNIVSLGEGATPLVNAPRLAEKHGLGALLLKNEATNPTGSFKDRQVCVGISHAVEQGYDTVAVVSSGNVASAAAAYAARAGIRAVLLMHGHAGATKIAQAQAYGATVIRVDSPQPSAVFDLCLEACEKYGWYHLSTAGMYEPWNVEGAKTIAYELYQQTGGRLPDWVVAPVGGGGLLGGIWRGFLDLQRLGVIRDVPRFAGVQAAGCAVLAEALEKDWSFLESLKHPWQDPKTIAGGIADDILFDGPTVLPAIRETNGVAPVVSDEEIVSGLRALASSEGLLAEFCSATTIAALPQLPEVSTATRVCCVLTGTGIKDLANLPTLNEPPRIPATLEALGGYVS